MTKNLNKRFYNHRMISECTNYLHEAKPKTRKYIKRSANKVLRQALKKEIQDYE